MHSRTIIDIRWDDIVWDDFVVLFRSLLWMVRWSKLRLLMPPIRRWIVAQVQRKETYDAQQAVNIAPDDAMVT
jgi:hypothetical protein